MANLSVAYYYDNAYDHMWSDGSDSDSKFAAYATAYDKIVTNAGGYYSLATAGFSAAQIASLESKTYRYFDWWGASRYDMRLDPDGYKPGWFPGPYDWGMPNVQYDDSSYLYTIDRDHTSRILTGAANLMRQFPDAAGVFVDDFKADLGTWGLPKAYRDRVWPMGKDAAGSGGDLWKWAEYEQEITEESLNALTAILGQGVVYNGSGKTLPREANRTASPRLWESVGTYTTKAELIAGAKAGDHVLVKGVNAARTGWTNVLNDWGGYAVGTSYQTVFQEIYDVCDDMDLYLGLGCAESPSAGGSTLTCHFWSDPDKWVGE